MSRRITARQTNVLAVALLMGTGTLLPVARPAGADSWLAIVLAAMVTAALVLIWGSLVQAVSSQSRSLDIDIWSATAGPFLGRLVAGLYLVFFIHIAASTVQQMGTIIGTVPLRHTPLPLLISLFVGLAVWAASHEIEGVARLSEVVIPLAFAASAAVMVLGFATPGLVHLDRLLPILDRGWLPVAHGVLAALSFPFAEVVILVAFAGEYETPQGWGRAVWRGLGLVCLLLVGISLRNLGALGVEWAGRTIFPGLSAVEMIRIGHFLERVEVLSLFVWVNAGFIKLTLFLLVATRALLALLALPPSSASQIQSPLLLAIAFAVASLSSGLYKTAMDAVRFYSEALPIYSLFFYLLFPLLLLAAHKTRTRARRSAPPSQPTS